MVNNFVLSFNQKYIRGVLHIPDIKTSDKFPILILCHGFTGNKCGDHFMFVKISRMLENIGIASIRFDFLGSGESDGNFKDTLLSDQNSTLEEVINYAKSLDYIDSENINILGHSMGGSVCVLSAANMHNNIKNTILISPALFILDELVNEIKGDKINIFLENDLIDFGGCTFSKKGIDELFYIDLWNKVKCITCKVLLIHGTNDQDTAPYCSIKVKELLKSNAELNFIKGADHCYSSDEYQKQLLDIINDYSIKNIQQI